MDQNEALMIVRGRRQARREHWGQLLADWDRSGLSGAEFAAERGVDVRGLYRWRRAARQGSMIVANPGLIEVPPVALSGWAAEVATRNGTVRLSSVAAPRWAAQLIRELSQC